MQSRTEGVGVVSAYIVLHTTRSTDRRSHGTYMITYSNNCGAGLWCRYVYHQQPVHAATCAPRVKGVGFIAISRRPSEREPGAKAIGENAARSVVQSN